MLARFLELFPAHTHPLTLVSDPDGLLGSEQTLVELIQRGFNVIQETDAVILLHRIEAARPVSREHPVMIITKGALENLPYDLYESAHRVLLALHQYFPNLAYPVVRGLNTAQLEKLSTCQQPSIRLGRRKTAEFILEQVFDLDFESLAQPAYFVDWLVRFHRQLAPLSNEIQAELLERLRRLPVYHNWDLPALLAEEQQLTDFLQTQWAYSLQASTEKSLCEASAEYVLTFDRDTGLQDLLPRLLRRRVITPLPLKQDQAIPQWARIGVIAAQESPLDRYRRQATDLLQNIHTQIFPTDHGDAVEHLKNLSWKQWQYLALDWADLSSRVCQQEFPLESELLFQFASLVRSIDAGFEVWLKGHYTPLAAQRLPEAKHVYHIPDTLAYLRSLGEFQKVALLILDGMSLMDWRLIQPVWSDRRPAWSFQTSLLLAQIPTVTRISRYGIISGLRPAEHIIDLNHAPVERSLWQGFWSRTGLSERSVDLLSIALDRKNLPAQVENSRLDTLCLIDDTLDHFSHSASLGTPDQLASLKLWLQPNDETNSMAIEALIESLLLRGFTVFLASDHGHVEATGFGSPTEGLVAQTRGKRARLYTDRLAAQGVQQAFPETLLWEGDSLLPEGMCALMPRGRKAFALRGEKVVTHGGMTPDEVIVPFVRIDLKTS